MNVAVIRTVDLGADRQAEYMAIPDEVNPIDGKPRHPPLP